MIPREVLTVCKALETAGYAPYLVGGCVRDLLRGAVPTDYDLTSDAPPQAVLALFGENAHPTGIAHGTVTVVCEGRAIELTTMRRDGAYRDSRHPESVVFTRKIEEDLARRDFTVNAIAMRTDGTLIDPFGGQKDLQAGILRCVGTARERMEEDALRILRLLRFAATLGFSVEEKTAAAAHEYAPHLAEIARERVYAELCGMLCGASVTAVLRAFPDVLGIVLPEILPCVGFEQKNPHHAFDVWEHTVRAVGFVPPQPALRWTMLLHDVGKPECFTVDENGVGHFYGHTAASAAHAEKIFTRLRFDHTTATAVRRQMACFDEWLKPERIAVHRLLARWGREAVAGLLATHRADQRAKTAEGVCPAYVDAAQKVYETLLHEGVPVTAGELAVDGKDVKEIGFTGVAIGAVLRKLLDEVVDEKLPDTKYALLRRAERLFRSGFGKE